jgi:hypothetical protein
MKKKSKHFRIDAAFADLQDEMRQCLITDKHIKHPVSKGTVTEDRWKEFFKIYLPERYKIDKAFIIDNKGSISDEIDLVIYDRQYSPFIFKRETSKYIPAESVYAVFEIKSALNRPNILYSGKKIKSVRKLKRTSAAITYVEGKYKPKKLFTILSGFLATTSDWKDPLGTNFKSVLLKLDEDENIDLGCVLESGAFEILRTVGNIEIRRTTREKALISFFMTLLIKLQDFGTCPAMDIIKYCRHL